MKITDKRMRELERNEAKLYALEAGGVDNWDNYDDSLTEFRAENELEERSEALLDDLEQVFGECAYEPSERGAGIAFSDDVRATALKVLTSHCVMFKEEE